MGTDRYVIPRRFWGWLGTRRAAAVLLWLAAIGLGIHHWMEGRHWARDSPNLPLERKRKDGARGHAEIDFGGQWTMARMFVLGHGRELYHRQRQWEVVRAGWPVENESEVERKEAHLPKDRRTLASPDEELRHDADSLMYSFMGIDPAEWTKVGGAAVAPLAGGPLNGLVGPPTAGHAADLVSPDVVKAVQKPVIGGPLYPPVHALMYAPLGLIAEPHRAHPVMQAFAIACCYLAGYGIHLISRGRVWWSAGCLVVLLYPGCRSGIDLGQNPAVSLAILTCGWGLAVRGRPGAGGAVWGLLAFKPSWAVAFLVVPVLMRRWRFALAMAGVGAALSLATLPFVGVQTWRDWLVVVDKATDTYNKDENWINFGRDLQGIPRRVLHDFAAPFDDRDTPLARGLALALLGTVFGLTVLVYLWRAGRREPTGLAAGFLFLGAYLCCFRFMYYDLMLSAVAFAVLLASWPPFIPRVFELRPDGLAGPAAFRPQLWSAAASFPLTILVLLMAWDNVLLGLDIRATAEVAYFARPVPPRVVAETSLAYPGDTFLVLALWLWCGVRLARGDAKPGGRFADPNGETASQL